MDRGREAETEREEHGERERARERSNVEMEKSVDKLGLGFDACESNGSDHFVLHVMRLKESSLQILYLEGSGPNRICIQPSD